jgi:triacylglycerol lipase
MNIILCHGILGFSKIRIAEIGVVNYFRGVKAHFEGKGHRVIAPAVDPTQGVEFRGPQLREQIEKAFTGSNPALDASQKTHIIAHSMGGLDSRFILAPNSPQRVNAKIRSLTTISTPHLGSPVADGLNSFFRFKILGLFSADSAAGALMSLGISLKGLRDLTTESCNKFNAEFPQGRPDRPQETGEGTIAFFSVAGSGRPGTAGLFTPLQPIFSLAGNPVNDGVVAVDSAKWGTFDEQTWPLDHLQEVGYNLDDPKTPTPGLLDRYDRILANVANL